MEELSMKCIFKRAISILIIIAIVILTGCNQKVESKGINVQETMSIMLENNSEFSNMVNTYEKTSIVYGSETISFSEYEGFEFPYPEDYTKKDGVHIEPPVLKKEKNIPSSVKKIYENALSDVNRFVNTQTEGFMTDDERIKLLSCLSNLTVHYGPFDENDEQFITIAIAVDDTDVYINSLYEVSKKDIIHELVHICAYHVGNQKESATIFDSGIWAEAMTDIITFSITGETEMNSVYAEFSEPVLYMIEKVGINELLNVYFHGNYEELECFNEFEAVYITLDAAFKFYKEGPSYEDFYIYSMQATVLALANIE